MLRALGFFGFLSFLGFAGLRVEYCYLANSCMDYG